MGKRLMFKRILFLLILLALAPAMWAQSTTVSGQVTDAGGQAWLNGTVTAQFVQNPLFVPQPQYVWAGGALNITISGTLSGTGSYSISIPSSTAIAPQGSSWKLQFCPAASSICYVTANFTATGATLTVNATPPAITVNPGPGALAYADSEITGAVVGSTYYNTTSFAQRICNGPAPCTWGNGGGGSPGSPAGCLQYNNGGAFSGASGICTPDGNSLSIKGPIPYRDITAYMPSGGCDQSAWNGVHQWGNMTAGSPNITLNGTVSIPNGCGIFVGNAEAVSTLATPARGSAPVPAVFGAAGSTTVNYEIVAIDKNFGTSAASAPITVTTANATRTAFNYVAIWWTSVANAVGYLVYTDQGTGTYVPLVQSFNCSVFTAGNVCGALDKGPELHSWTGFNDSIWPLTPPASPTNGALITTVLSGGGTQNLVLAANAINSVTQSGSYFPYVSPDVSAFVGAALADAATDGTASNRGKVFIPEGRWVMSTIPYPTTVSGIQIEMLGRVNLFGLPAGTNVIASGGTGNVSFHGTGGSYQGSGWRMTCSQFVGQSSLGALIVVNNGTMNMDHLCLASVQGGIIQGNLGVVTAQDTNFFSWASSMPMLQVDANAFFSQWDRTIWDFGAEASNTGIPALWFLGLTNNGHASALDFRNNSFSTHTIRVDVPYTTGGTPYFGNPIKFDGLTFTENNYDQGLVVEGTCNTLQQVTFEDMQTGDIQNATQSFIYNAAPLSGCSPGPQPGVAINIRGQSSGNISNLVGAAITIAPVNCRGWTYESPNLGGGGANSIGYWGNYFGKYTGCDNGITQTGYDLQTSEVLTSGGNDGNGPAGEQIVGHIFRRPFTTLTTSTTTGSLAPATYFIKVTMVDVAGRESAPSPEVSIIVPAGTSTNIVNVSAVTQIFFPAACNVYFSTTAGAEAAFFQSTTITNGTCTFTLTTTAGGTSRTPMAVGNAMRSWLTEENNAPSCLFCGNSNSGIGFLGIGLSPSQYTSALAAGGPGVFVGGVFYAYGNIVSNIQSGTQCVHANSAGLLSGTGSDCGGVTNPMTTLGDDTAGGAAGVFTRIAGPTAAGTYVKTEKPSSGAATAETYSLAGVVPNAQTGTTYTYLATDATSDRAGYTSFSNAGAIAATLPQAGSTGFGSNWVNVSCAIGAGTVTITPTTSTISYSTGAAYTSAAASLALTTGQCAWIYSDNTNYFAIVRTGGAGTVTSVATTSPITGGPITGAGNIACATCTTNAAALTNNVLVKGAVGQATQTSSVTDNGTTVTTTDTGGYVGPSFTANGLTAGFMDYPQGSTSAAVAPCNAATSICEQAPTAVISYLLNKLAGPSSGIKLESNASAVLTETSSGDANHSIHVTAQTATKTIYTLCPASAGGCNVAGQYRVTWYFNQGGTACGTPTPGQVTFALSWTDNAGAHSAIALPMNDDSSIAVFTSAFKFAATNATGFASGEFNIWSTGAQPIQVTNTYTGCGVGTGTWELTASVEQVQ